MENPTDTLRVLSYNVHRLRDDLNALCAVVKEINPDVVLFQEISRGWFWRDRASVLLARTGLISVVGGRHAYGNMVAVRPEIQVHSSDVIRLPNHLCPKLRALIQGMSLKEALNAQPRAAVWAHCELNGHQFLVSGVHLGHIALERRHHIGYLLQKLPKTAPLILGGDLNENVGGPVWQRLSRTLVDAGAGSTIPTYSTSHPRLRIDALFTTSTISSNNYHVQQSELAAKASDHRPIYTDLKL